MDKPSRMKPGPKPKAANDPTRTVRMTFTLTPAVAEKLRANADQAGMSATIERLIADALG